MPSPFDNLGAVRAVAETKPHLSHPYVSIIRFANCYSVTLSYDPSGYAGYPFDRSRLVVTQTESMGRAAAAFNRLAMGGGDDV